MSNVAANDVRDKYDKAFATIRGIIEAFPEDKWLQPHGDEYYIPCRIAYHLAVFIDGIIAGNFSNPDFGAKLPFGDWMKGTTETLPDKKKFLAYFEEAVAHGKKALEALTDESLIAPLAPEQARFGATAVGMHLQFMRELSDHTGELNKMLVENGLEDIWISR
ncbi:MAG: DinB family protein [Clostridiales bacterium]|nr:DinB family protein [Clostridiales bacterium]